MHRFVGGCTGDKLPFAFRLCVDSQYGRTIQTQRDAEGPRGRGFVLGGFRLGGRQALLCVCVCAHGEGGPVLIATSRPPPRVSFPLRIDDEASGGISWH